MNDHKTNSIRSHLRKTLPSISEEELNLAEERYREFLKALCALYLARKRHLERLARRDSEDSAC